MTRFVFALLATVAAASSTTLAAQTGPKPGTPEWFKLHPVPVRLQPLPPTRPVVARPVAPSQFHAQTPLAPIAAPTVRPATNNYVVPTHNATNAQNSTPPRQAQNATQSTNAVQGKNCTPALHRARIC